MQIHLFRRVLIVTLTLTACTPRTTPVPLLSAIPAGTLTALAPTDTPVVPTRTPRPSPLPTRTPAPSPSETATTPPTATSTPAPVSVDPALPRITPFAAGTVLRFVSVQTFTGGLGWGVAEPRLDRDDHVVVTRDGGYQWRDVTPPQPITEGLASGWAARTFALNGETAWLVFYDRAAGARPERAWVWRTADAGATWSTSVALDLSEAAGFMPLDLHFVDVAHGWLLVADAAQRDPTSRRLFATDDGGVHWSVVSSWSALTGDVCETGAIRRVSEADGYLFAACPGALDRESLVRVTHDGGATWSPLALPLPDGFPSAFDGRCAATPEWATATDLTLRVDCLAADTGVLAQYLYRSQAVAPGGFGVAGFGETGLLDAAFYGPGEALLLVDPRPDRAGDLYLLRTADAGANTQRQRAVRWVGILETAGPAQMWAILSSDAYALYTSTDGGQTWGRTDAVIVE